MDQVVLAILSFGIGYSIGSLDNIRRALKKTDHISFDLETKTEQLAREQKQHQSKKKIVIDDSKYVTDISTDGLESKGQRQLGVVSSTSDDISSAASKLAQLKKMKDS
jgi:hypothetical protein